MVQTCLTKYFQTAAVAAVTRVARPQVVERKMQFSFKHSATMVGTVNLKVIVGIVVTVTD